MSFDQIKQALHCLLGQHQWKPYHLQLWICPLINLAEYKDAQCAACHRLKGKPTRFILEDIPSDQIMGKYPYQITNDGVLWHTAGYPPPEDLF